MGDSILRVRIFDIILYHLVYRILFINLFITYDIALSGRKSGLKVSKDHKCYLLGTLSRSFFEIPNSFSVR